MGSTLEALEADLAAWGRPPGVLVEVARRLAAELDREPTANEAAVLSRELRQVVRAIRDSTLGRPTELDRFLAEIQAEGFGL